jgi:hypothetical protein
MDRRFCVVCGSECQILLVDMPKTCPYACLGDVICLECCRECDYYDGCSEIRSRLDAVLSKKTKKIWSFASKFWSFLLVLPSVEGLLHTLTFTKKVV